MKPTIEILTYALRGLHRKQEVKLPRGGVLLRCAHCAEPDPHAPRALWPCPTIALVGAVLRGDA